MKRQLEPGLLACLTQCGSFEREIGRLDVPARLQQPAELRMGDQADPFARLVDDERRRREMGRPLVP